MSRIRFFQVVFMADEDGLERAETGRNGIRETSGNGRLECRVKLLPYLKVIRAASNFGCVNCPGVAYRLGEVTQLFQQFYKSHESSHETPIGIVRKTPMHFSRSALSSPRSHRAQLSPDFFLRQNSVMFGSVHHAIHACHCLCACRRNGPELKSLASGRSGGARRVSEVGPVHFSSAARKSGDNDASLIHVAALAGISACWRGRDLITDKRPPCYAVHEEAIRVPVSPLNFNSRRRIEFVKSFMGEGAGERGSMEEGRV